MKGYLRSAVHFFRKSILFFSVFAFGFVCFAQDKQVDVNINVKKDNFWDQPWVWIVGAAVFVLLLAAILRSGGRRRDV